MDARHKRRRLVAALLAITAGLALVVAGAAVSSAAISDTGTASIPDVWGSTTERVSVGHNKAWVGGGDLSHTAISADGRYVVFPASSELLPSDGGGYTDLYIRDRRRNATRRVAAGSDMPSVSRDGRFVAFVGYQPNQAQVFLRDQRSGELNLLSAGPTGEPGNYYQYSPPQVTADGRLVFFGSEATNLLRADPDELSGLLVYNVRTGVLRQVKRPAGAAPFDLQDGKISPNGRWVAFDSSEQGLVPGDSGGVSDVFLLDRRTRELAQVSVGHAGQQAEDNSYAASVSTGGDRVAFASDADNLVPGFSSLHAQGFVRTMATGRTEPVTASPAGAPAIIYSHYDFDIAANGRYVAFESISPNLVRRDRNGQFDIFVRDLRIDRTRRATVAHDGHEVIGDSGAPAISDNGAHVAFQSTGGWMLIEGGEISGGETFVRSR
jgi:Tol biopolymer transport system component